jgi:hypothetical protein
MNLGTTFRERLMQRIEQVMWLRHVAFPNDNERKTGERSR